MKLDCLDFVTEHMAGDINVGKNYLNRVQPVHVSLGIWDLIDQFLTS